MKIVPETPSLAPYRNPDETTLATDSISIIMPEIDNNSDEAGQAEITSYHLEWLGPSDTEF